MTVGMFLFFKVGMPALEQMLHEGSLKTVGIPSPYSSLEFFAEEAHTQV